MLSKEQRAAKLRDKKRVREKQTTRMTKEQCHDKDRQMEKQTHKPKQNKEKDIRTRQILRTLA